MTDSKIRVLIADDSLMIRDSLEQMISGEPDMTVVAVAKDGLEALEKTRQFRPDVVLTDLSMPRWSGRDAIPQIKMRFPAQKILVFTVSTSLEDIRQMFRLGAMGYLPKSSSITTIFDAIRRVAAGEAIIPPSIAVRLVNEFHTRYAANFDLKPDEMRIMNLIEDGLSSTEVAYRVLLGESDVNRVLRRFLEILQTELRAEAEDVGRFRVSTN